MWNNRNDLAIIQQFRADFCMTPDAFMDIVTLVRNSLEKQDARFREAVPIEKTVAIVLWRLATGNSYRSISKIFAVGKSTAVSIIIYQNILSNFREPQVEQPKPLLHLKKPLTVKFLRLSVQFGLLELISHNPMLV